MTTTHRPGPGVVAHANHADLCEHLSSLCLHARIDHQRKVALGATPYGGIHHADLLLSGLPGYPHGLAVVARWQGVSGSADQKLSYLLESIFDAGVPTIIVLDGAAWQEHHWSYLSRKIDGPYFGALDVEAFEALLAAAKRASW